MIASNLFEVLAVVALGFPPLLVLTGGLLFKFVIERKILERVDYTSFMDYEYSYAFIVAWYGGMIMLSIFGPLFWIDIWEAPNNIESAMYIFVLWMLLGLVKWWWFSTLYIRQSTSLGVVKFTIILDVCIAVAYSLLILLTLHLADRPWYHWFVLLTIIHPAFEWVAMLNANKYRQQINSSNYPKNIEEQSSHDPVSTIINDVAGKPSMALANFFGFGSSTSSN